MSYFQQSRGWTIEPAFLGMLIGVCLATILVCGTASAQNTAAAPPTGGVDDVPTLASLGPPARAALNLEVTGWVTALSSAPALALALSPRFNCGSGRLGLAPGITFGVGVTVGIVGSILRARRFRDVPRTRVTSRQGLFRSPSGRGLGLALLSMASGGTTIATTVIGADLWCSD